MQISNIKLKNVCCVFIGWRQSVICRVPVRPHGRSERTRAARSRRQHAHEGNGIYRHRNTTDSSASALKIISRKTSLLKHDQI